MLWLVNQAARESFMKHLLVIFIISQIDNNLIEG